jgi:hypothetical protein
MTPISAHILQQAIELYLKYAYPAGTFPPAAQERAKPIQDLPPSQNVPESLLEKECSASLRGYALRLGQPLYPHMKLIIEPAPEDPAAADLPNAIHFLLRVDSHDRHLHAAPGSPDEAWLSNIRASNKLLGEQIEAAWSQHGLPTFKDYLRARLAAKKAQQLPH